LRSGRHSAAHAGINAVSRTATRMAVTSRNGIRSDNSSAVQIRTQIYETDRNLVC
jgi:hypothetical protein